MGEMYGTCGHKIDFETQVALAIKDFTREGERCVSYGVYCPECAKWFRRHRCVLKDEEAEDRWLIS